MNTDTELQKLQFFDLPQFYKHFDERYKETAKYVSLESRALNACYLGLKDTNRYDLTDRLWKTFHSYSGNRSNTNHTLEYFYDNLIEPEWVEEVKQHIQTIQNQ